MMRTPVIRSFLDLRSRKARSLAGWLLIFSTIAPLTLRAQIAILRPIAGYEYGVPLALDRTPGNVNRFRSTGGGSAWNHAGWLGVELLDRNLFGERSGAAMRLSLALSSGAFISDPYSSAEMIDRSSGEIVATTNRFELHAVASTLQIELPLYYQPAPGIALTLGAWGSYRLASGLVATEHNIDGHDVVFGSSGSGSRIVAAGEELGSAPVHGGLRAGITADLRLPSGSTITPELLLRIDAGALAEGLGFRSLSIGAGLAFTLGSSDARPIDTPLVPLAQLPLSNAAVDLYNATDPGAPVRISSRRVLFRDYRPIRAVAGNASATRDRIPLTRADAATFQPSELAAQELGGHLLDIVGWRLRRMEEASVVIRSGERSEGEAIARYLVEIWEIAPQRIRIIGGRGGSKETRIESSDPLVLAPVVTQMIEESFIAPRIGVRRAIDTLRPFAAWELSIAQGGREIIHRGGRSAPSFDAALPIDSVARDGSPLIARLTLDDGREKRSVFDTLALEIDPRPRNDTVHTFHLPERPDDYPPGAFDTMIALAATVIDSNTRVTITCPRGNPEAGRHLARRLLEHAGAAEIRFVEGETLELRVEGEIMN